MKVLFDNEKSIYLQIAEMLESDILRDILQEEERVLSTNDLAKLYNINPATAAKGINLLVDEGVLYKKRGIGMFVATGSKQKIREMRKKEFVQNYIEPILKEARALGLTREDVQNMIKNIGEEK